MSILSFPWKEMVWPTAATQEVAVKLLISSIFLSKTYVDKYSAQIGDCITRCLHRILPISLQESLRNAGFISMFGNLGAFVAACTYCSTNLQALLDMMHISRRITCFQYGSTRKHFIEVFTPLDSSHNNYETSAITERTFGSHGKPATLVFVHGGAWGCGKTWQYRLVANGIGRLLGVQKVVLIGYPTYPTSTILQQRDCVSTAMKFIHENTAVKWLLKNDSNHTTILCGHSSGANICALALLDNLNKDFSAEEPVQTVLGPTTMNVDLFIGLAGVFDINKHYFFEENRGVHVISPMTAAAGGKNGFNACSPTIVARQLYQQNMLSTSTGMGVAPRLKRLPCTVLIHGSDDLVVPPSSSYEFLQAIQELGNDPMHELITLDECDHMHPIMEGLEGTRTPHSRLSVALSRARVAYHKHEASLVVASSEFQKLFG